MKSPTDSFYRYLEEAFSFFNRTLFKDRLPACLLTVQRDKSLMGFFSPNRWTDPEGNTVHELALNPSYFSRHNLMEVFQTIVHELAHNWQHSFGKPSRSGYHNKEWAAKMESIGLMPSHNGLPGGKKTGQRMSDYPIPGGAFEQAAKAFIKRSKGLPWIDRFAALTPSCQVRDGDFTLETEWETPKPEQDELESLLHVRMNELFEDLVPNEQLQQAARQKVKIRYSCPECQTNVWGKPGLKLNCGECGSSYTASMPVDALSPSQDEDDT
ncbi:MAG: SprT-like domain-containing protein [Pseudomonadota bacterium]